MALIFEFIDGIQLGRFHAALLNTWVDNGVRYFTGNGVPNHPTGLFPIPSDQPAYPWYAELPDPGGQCK